MQTVLYDHRLGDGRARALPRGWRRLRGDDTREQGDTHETTGSGEVKHTESVRYGNGLRRVGCDL